MSIGSHLWFLSNVATPRRKADFWNEKKPRFRKTRTGADWCLAQFRGYWESPDLSKYSHEDIGEVVGSTLKHLGLKNRFDEGQVLSSWAEIVGDFVAKNSQPVEVRQRVLIVQVLQPAVHYEIERMKGKILSRMQERFGKQHIRGIKFRLG